MKHSQHNQVWMQTAEAPVVPTHAGRVRHPQTWSSLMYADSGFSDGRQRFEEDEEFRFPSFQELPEVEVWPPVSAPRSFQAMPGSNDFYNGAAQTPAAEDVRFRCPQGPPQLTSGSTAGCFDTSPTYINSVEVAGEENDMTYTQDHVEQNPMEGVLDWDNIWEDERINEEEPPTECEPSRPVSAVSTYHAPYHPVISHQPIGMDPPSEWMNFACASSSGMQHHEGLGNLGPTHSRLIMSRGGHDNFQDTAEIPMVGQQMERFIIQPGGHGTQLPLQGLDESSHWRPSFEAPIEENMVSLQHRELPLPTFGAYPAWRPSFQSTTDLSADANESVHHGQLQQPRRPSWSVVQQRPGTRGRRDRRLRLNEAVLSGNQDRLRRVSAESSETATSFESEGLAASEVRGPPPSFRDQNFAQDQANMPRTSFRRRVRERARNRTAQGERIPTQNWRLQDVQHREHWLNSPQNRRGSRFSVRNASNVRPDNQPIYIPLDERPSFGFPTDRGISESEYETFFSDQNMQGNMNGEPPSTSWEAQSPKVVTAMLSYMPTEVLTEKRAEEELCVICREPMCEGEEVRRLPCFHMFHTACIDQWLEVKMTCPCDNLRVDEMVRALTCLCDHCLSTGMGPVQ